VAFEIGTATGPADLFAKLKSFLTTNADLTTASQQWTQVWDTSNITDPENETDVVFSGPGLAGAESVIVGMRLRDDAASDEHWIEYTGAISVNAAAQNFREHNGSMLRVVRTMLNNGPMSYWFVANGRRFITVIKISTTYQSSYCGLLLPFGLPQEYPYPLFIGGCCGDDFKDSNGYMPRTWRDNVRYHTFFLSPDGYVSGSYWLSSAWVRGPAGDWKGLNNVYHNLDGSVGPSRTGGNNTETLVSANSGVLNGHTILGAMETAYGGDRVLVPAPVFLRVSERETLGVLQGVNRVAGAISAAEDVVTIDGTDHLTVPNVFRTDFHDYMTVELS